MVRTTYFIQLISAGISSDVILSERKDVADNLHVAEKSGVDYVLVVGRLNEEHGTVALNILKSTYSGRPEGLNPLIILYRNCLGFDDIHLYEAVRMIARREEMLNSRRSYPPRPGSRYPPSQRYSQAVPTPDDVYQAPPPPPMDYRGPLPPQGYPPQSRPGPPPVGYGMPPPPPPTSYVLPPRELYIPPDQVAPVGYGAASYNPPSVPYSQQRPPQQSVPMPSRAQYMSEYPHDPMLMQQQQQQTQQQRPMPRPPPPLPQPIGPTQPDISRSPQRQNLPPNSQSQNTGQAPNNAELSDLFIKLNSAGITPENLRALQESLRQDADPPPTEPPPPLEAQSLLYDVVAQQQAAATSSSQQPLLPRQQWVPPQQQYDPRGMRPGAQPGPNEYVPTVQQPAGQAPPQSRFYTPPSGMSAYPQPAPQYRQSQQPGGMPPQQRRPGPGW